MLRTTEDVGVGDWIAPRLGALGSVGGLMPSGFDAYCRLLFPIDGPTSDPDPHTWAEVFDAPVPPGAQAQEVLATLPDDDPRHTWSVDASAFAAVLPALRDAVAAFTAPEARVLVAVWEGWGDLPDRTRAASRLHLPARAYYLFEGGIDDVDGHPWNAIADERPGSAVTLTARWLGDGTPPASRPRWNDSVGWHDPPGLIWPADQSWFVAADTDLDSAYVGGSEALIAALLGAPGLEVVTSAWDDPA